MYMCVYVCVCAHVCHGICMEIRGQLGVRTLFPLGSSRDQTQVFRFCGNHLYLLNLLADPCIFLYCSVILIVIDLALEPEVLFLMLSIDRAFR